MSHNIENVSSTKRKITVNIEAKEVNNSINSTIQEYGKSLNLNGFRKGKVPASVIEKRFGEEVYNYATENLINATINKILEEEKIRPVSRVHFENQEDAKKLTRDNDFEFTCSFDVLPEIDLPKDFSEYSVNVESAEASQEEIDNFTTQIRRSMATLEDVNEVRNPVDGDVLLVDVEGMYEGTPVPGMGAQNFLMQLSDNKDATNKEIDTLVRTAKPGEEVKGTMVCPDDYANADFRGKTIDITIKLHKIHKQILPELDEEFAKKVGFNDVATLKEAIETQVKQSKAAHVKSTAQQELIDTVLEKYNYELPASMVQKALSNYMMEARNHLGQQNIDPEEMLKALASLKEDGQKIAEKQTKEHVFLLAIAYRENFVVSGQEIDMYVRQLAMETRQSYEQVRDHVLQSGMIQDIQERLMAGKALDLMFDQAKHVEVASATPEKAEKPKKTTKAKEPKE